MDESKLSKTLENRLSTFVDIETVLDRNSDIIMKITELKDSTANFKQIISDINTKAVKRNNVKKGTSQAKSLKRTELEDMTVALSAALFAYGHKTSNEVVKAISNIPPSLLERMRDSDMVNKAGAVLTTLNEYAAELPPYGISADDITELRDAIDNYRSSNTVKSGSHMESIVITKSLHELFQSGMDILDNEIDRMVNSLQKKEKNFYDSYYAVRSVKNLGLRHRKHEGPDSQSVVN